MVPGLKMLILKVQRNRASSKSQVFIKNVLTFFQRKATLKTTDIPPSSSASISVFWGRSHVADHVRSCIGIQTYNTYADGNSCTSSFEGLAGASLTLINRARRSNCLRRCRTPPLRNFYTVRACASLGPAPLPRRSVPPCSLIKIYNYYYLSCRGDQAISHHMGFHRRASRASTYSLLLQVGFVFFKKLGSFVCWSLFQEIKLIGSFKARQGLGDRGVRLGRVWIKQFVSSGRKEGRRAKE